MSRSGDLAQLETLPCRQVLGPKDIKNLLKALVVDEEEKKTIAPYCIVPVSGWEAIQGRRWDLQDVMVALDNILHYKPDVKGLTENIAFYAVFDGHGGREVADILETLFLDTLLGPECLPLLVAKDYEQALRQTFRICGAVIESFCLERNLKGVGSCASVCLLAGHQLYVANIGDSELFLGRRQVLMSTNYLDLILTQRHSPEFPPDSQRVLSQGGKIADNRVEGKLAITRAFGDISLRGCCRADKKDLVFYDPFVRTYPLCARDDFLVLACDGLFDVLKPKDIAAMVRKGLSKSHTPTKVAESLITSVMNLRSSDNVSALVVFLYKSKNRPSYPDSYYRAVPSSSSTPKLS